MGEVRLWEGAPPGSWLPAVRPTWSSPIRSTPCSRDCSHTLELPAFPWPPCLPMPAPILLVTSAHIATLALCRSQSGAGVASNFSLRVQKCPILSNPSRARVSSGQQVDRTPSVKTGPGYARICNFMQHTAHGHPAPPIFPTPRSSFHLSNPMRAIGLRPLWTPYHPSLPALFRVLPLFPSVSPVDSETLSLSLSALFRVFRGQLPLPIPSNLGDLWLHRSYANHP